jgi:hypothetical protein
MKSYFQKGNAQVLKRVHAMTSRIVANARLPLVFTTDPDLHAVLNAATYLSPCSFVPMTSMSTSAYVIQLFSSFVSRALLAATRALYLPSDKDSTASTEGWIIVGHDAWVPDATQFFGVSIFFINPSSWERTQQALGLATPAGHGAEDCALAASEVLEIYGITK